MELSRILNEYGDLVYLTFNKIPLNFNIIYGNMIRSEWYKIDSNLKFIQNFDENLSSEWILEQIKNNDNVLFENIKYNTDILDYHSDSNSLELNTHYIKIEQLNRSVIKLLIEPENILFFGSYPLCDFSLPYNNRTTVYDFIRICNLSGINLIFSKHAINILSKKINYV